MPEGELTEGGGRRERRSLFIAAAGTVIEWYDFGLYLYLAPIYARVFFGGGSEIEGLIASLGVFAVGFVARPIGALVFGRYGDRAGRRQALLISAALISGALAVNAAIPLESEIGIAAPLLLLASRLVAGFAIGAEYSGILSFLLESSSPRHRGLVTSMAPALSGVGTLLAVGLTALVASLLTVDQLDTWGWRIPVAGGAIIAAALLLFRRGLEETPEFERLKTEGKTSANPVREALERARAGVIYAFVISAVGSIGWYLNISYLPTYVDSFTDIPHAQALRWGTIVAAAVIGFALLAGAASDRWGRQRTLTTLCLILILTTVPLFALLDSDRSAIVFAAMIALAVPAASWSSISASSIPEQLPSRVRFSGLALGYNTAVALFGGLTPLLATALLHWTGAEVAPAFLVVVVALAGLLSLRGRRETAGVPLEELNRPRGGGDG